MALKSPRRGVQATRRRYDAALASFPSRSFYVDATLGNDANSGTYPDEAWQTIAKVNGETFLPGDRTLFKRGETWREEFLPPSSGAAGLEITIDAYGSGNRPIINGADIFTTWVLEGGTVYSKAGIGTEPVIVIYDGVLLTENDGALATVGADEWDWNANTLYINVGEDPDTGVLEASQRGSCIYVNNKDYIRIRNISVRHGNNGIESPGNSDYIVMELNVAERCGTSGLYAAGSNITMRNNTIDDINPAVNNTQGIYFSGVTNGKISNNVVSNCMDGIRGLSATTGVTISRNTVFDCTDDGIDCGNAGTENNLFELNLVYDCGDDGIKLLAGANNNRVINNIVYGCGLNQYAIAAENIKLYHNIAGEGGAAPGAPYPFGFYFATTVRNVIMENCISVGNNRHVVKDAGATISSIDNNSYFPDTATRFSWEGALHNFAAWQAASGDEANSINTDQDFVNEPANDYHINVGSPCRGAGAIDTGVTEDYDGVARPDPPTQPDIGAYQFVP